MIDLAYMIESADVRLPNACPELPDMENEQVSKSGLRACKGCGKEFITTNCRIKFCVECRVKHQKRLHVCEACGVTFKNEHKGRAKVCPKCKIGGERREKPRVFTTENVREATREAMRHGISYGKYMQMIRK